MAQVVYYVVPHQGQWEIKIDGQHRGPYRDTVRGNTHGGGCGPRVREKGRGFPGSRPRARRQVSDRVDLREGRLSTGGVTVRQIARQDQAPQHNSRSPGRGAEFSTMRWRNQG